MDAEVIDNVGKLKKLIENLPDDMLIVTLASDHQYRSVVVDVAKAEQLYNGYFNEYYGDEFSAGNPIVDVLLIY